MPPHSSHPNRRQTLDTGAVTRFGFIVPAVYFFPGMLICPILLFCRSALVSLRIRIKFIFSLRIRIRIQGAKPMRIRRFKNPFERQETRFICYLWSISMLLDPDPHSQYRSGSRTAKSIRIHADPDQQHGYFNPWTEHKEGCALPRRHPSRQQQQQAWQQE